jgi:hypothetical protein
MNAIERFDARAERVQSRLTVLRTQLPAWEEEAVPRRRDELLRAGRTLDRQICAIDICRQRIRNLNQKVVKQENDLQALDNRAAAVTAEKTPPRRPSVDSRHSGTRSSHPAARRPAT